jgi:hypothetical protein
VTMSNRRPRSPRGCQQRTARQLDDPGRSRCPGTLQQQRRGALLLAADAQGAESVEHRGSLETGDVMAPGLGPSPPRPSDKELVDLDDSGAGRGAGGCGPHDGRGAGVHRYQLWPDDAEDSRELVGRRVLVDHVDGAAGNQTGQLEHPRRWRRRRHNGHRCGTAKLDEPTAPLDDEQPDLEPGQRAFGAGVSEASCRPLGMPADRLAQQRGHRSGRAQETAAASAHVVPPRPRSRA